jgi:hypothetical protein
MAYAYSRTAGETAGTPTGRPGAALPGSPTRRKNAEYRSMSAEAAPRCGGACAGVFARRGLRPLTRPAGQRRGLAVLVQWSFDSSWDQGDVKELPSR